MIDYSILPGELREGMRRYVEHGIRPGGFLMACLSNDFVEVIRHCQDDINVRRLCDVAKFLWWELPSTLWGSRERVNQYSEDKKAERLGPIARGIGPARPRVAPELPEDFERGEADHQP